MSAPRAPSRTNGTRTSAGAIITAAISSVPAQPWPRTRIQTTMPIDMSRAISRMVSSGWVAMPYSTPARATTPRTRPPRTNIPASIATTIST